MVQEELFILTLIYTLTIMLIVNGYKKDFLKINRKFVELDNKQVFHEKFLKQNSMLINHLVTCLNQKDYQKFCEQYFIENSRSDLKFE